jgi:hypothetical protein
VHSCQANGSLPHPVRIKVVFHPPAVRLFKSSPSFRDEIDITSGYGIVPGMKTAICFFSMEDMDIRRQEVIDPDDQFLNGNLRSYLKVCCLPEGMDSAVGPPCSVKLIPLSREKLVQNIEKLPLDGAAAFLCLPPVIPGTVIFQNYPVFCHGLSVNFYSSGLFKQPDLIGNNNAAE